MSWGCPDMLESSSDLDVISNRSESIRSLFKGYIPLDARDIQVQSFNHLASSYLKWCACSQILAFLTSLKWKPFRNIQINKTSSVNKKAC